MTSSWSLLLVTTSSSVEEDMPSFCWQVLSRQVRAMFLAELSRSLICSEMVRRISEFDPFALDKDSTFALAILSNLITGLEILSVKEEDFVLVLATFFWDQFLQKRWFSFSAIVLRMAFV